MVETPTLTCAVSLLGDNDDGSATHLGSRRHAGTSGVLRTVAGRRNALTSWRGSPITDEAAQRFDLETLIGVPALIQVIHRESDGTTWANINAVMRLQNDDDKLEIVDYVRVKDRDDGPLLDDEEDDKVSGSIGGDDEEGRDTPFG